MQGKSLWEEKRWQTGVSAGWDQTTHPNYFIFWSAHGSWPLTWGGFLFSVHISVSPIQQVPALSWTTTGNIRPGPQNETPGLSLPWRFTSNMSPTHTWLDVGWQLRLWTNCDLHLWATCKNPCGCAHKTPSYERGKHGHIRGGAVTRPYSMGGDGCESFKAAVAPLWRMGPCTKLTSGLPKSRCCWSSSRAANSCKQWFLQHAVNSSPQKCKAAKHGHFSM